MKALMLSADGFEDLELLVPYHRQKEAGLEVEVASAGKETLKGEHGYRVAVDKSFGEVRPEEYAILFLPGGQSPGESQKK